MLKVVGFLNSAEIAISVHGLCNADNIKIFRILLSVMSGSEFIA